ncbi:MAG: histidine--tRNA ligase [Caldisericia bacterium]|nr:histidine--tRNA ligase [Caldisericia bacterium]
MIKGPKGAPDILPDKSRKIEKVINKLRKFVENFGYREIILPIFEHAEIFERSVGEETDIVQKEMYTFYDKGGRKLCLRPEGTAQVVRSYIENNFKQLPQPVKLYYYGPMFRYEKPQKGRFREFYHFGIEALGEDSPSLDVEIIYISIKSLENLGLKDLFIYINSIGDIEDRKEYKEVLKSYLKDKENYLCDDCKKRLYLNPLRVLDCKNELCIKTTENAPKILDYIKGESKKHFDEIIKKLDELKINYILNPRLVRGLDYYNRTVFEVISQNLGSQNSVLGGGRYDYLSSFLGGDRVPGVGFAIGVERLILILEKENLIQENIEKIISITPLNKEYYEESFLFYLTLGEKGYNVIFPYNFKNLKESISYSLKRNASFLIIYGGDELKDGYLLFKDLKKETQIRIKKDEIFKHLNEVKDA